MKIDTSKLKNIVLNFLIPIISTAVSVILGVFVIYPLVKQVPMLKLDLEKNIILRNQLSSKLTKLSNFTDFKSVLQEDSDLVNKVMPAEQNVPGLLDQLDQVSKETGLDVTKLSYSISDFMLKDPGAPAFNAVLVSLGAEGTYNQMISFMKTLETSARLVNISNFRFNSSNQKDSNRLSFTFILSAPYLNVQSSAVVDDPLGLDITEGDFISFINKIKNLRYFEKSGDELFKKSVQVSVEDITGQAQESSQSSSSSKQ